MLNECSPFRQAANEIEHRLKKTQKMFDRVKALTDQGFIAEAYDVAFDFAAECERLTLMSRSFPHYTGHPQAVWQMEQCIQESIPVEIRFTVEGWFILRIPELMPRKERGSPEYVRGFLYPAMKRFFDEWPRIRFAECVIIFRHIYNRARPERQYRDHDNIDINAIVDIITTFLLDDDGQLRCYHFYMSAAGNDDCTEIIILEQSDFTRWLYVENIIKNEVSFSREKPP